MVTVVVIDDHPFFRDGLTRGLTTSGRVRVLGEAGDGAEGIDLIRTQRPDVAVVDYQMPGVDGIGVVHAVQREGLPTRVLLLSAITDPAIVFAALQEGAAGYLSKDARRSEIVGAVDRIARGHTVVPPELTAGLVQQIQIRAERQAPVLSARETQVIRGFALGLSVPQLAAELDLAPSTVKTHTLRLYEKLGVSDRAAAVATAMRLGPLE